MFIGIDVGSSRCKVAALDTTGRLQHSASRRSPSGLYEPGYSLRPFVDGLICDLVHECVDTTDITGLAVSCVAPALACFNASELSPQVVFSHLTPVASPASQGLDLASRLEFRKARTMARIVAAGDRMDGEPTGFLPMASAIALMLTGAVRLDLINAYELGFLTLEDLAAFCHMSSPGTAMVPALAKLSPRLVVATTTDTCASLLVGGLRQVGDGLLYYGTYHCALALAQPLQSCLFATELPGVPYYWHVSLPRYGMVLERLLHAFSSDISSERIWIAFEEALARGIQANTLDTTIIVEPRLPMTVTSDTLPMIDVHNITLSATFDEFAMALATPFAHALRTTMESGALDSIHTWFAAGGGSANRALLQVTSTITGLRQFVHRDSATAAGTAQLAMFSETGDQSLPTSSDGTWVRPHER